MIRHYLPALLSGLLLLSGTGCVFSIGSGNCPPPVSPPAVAQSDPCAVDPREYTVTIDEIAAAARLDFDPSRAEILGAIAKRRGLTPAEQEYLACITLHRLSFDPAKSDVLRQLIDNPDFSYRAKGMILRHLNLLAFDPARADLMRAMQGKGEPPPAPTEKPVRDGNDT
jgi:hypothetical protein